MVAQTARIAAESPLSGCCVAIGARALAPCALCLVVCRAVLRIAQGSEVVE